MHLNEYRWEIERNFRDYAWMQYDFFQDHGLLDANDRHAVEVLDREKSKNGWVGIHRENYSKLMHPAVREAREKEQEPAHRADLPDQQARRAEDRAAQELILSRRDDNSETPGNARCISGVSYERRAPRSVRKRCSDRISVPGPFPHARRDTAGTAENPPQKHREPSIQCQPPQKAPRRKRRPERAARKKSAGFREKSRKKDAGCLTALASQPKPNYLLPCIGAAGCAVPSAIAGRPYLRSRRSSDWVMSREIEIEINWMAPMMRSA